MTKNKSLVSIIIPTYNYGHYIADAIESALNQTYSNIEVLIVDDGSTDNTRNIVKGYPVKYFYQEHEGPAVALNNGIKKSCGEFFIRLDADDKIFPEFVSKTIKQMKKPDVGFVCVGSKIWNEEIGIEDIWIPHKIYTKYALFAGWIGVLGCILVRRSAFESLEYGFDPGLPVYEDLDLCFRLLLKGWKMGIVPEPLHWYRVHKNSRNYGQYDKKRFVENLMNRKYKLIQPYIKFYGFYKNTLGRIVSFLTQPLEYLKGTREKIKNEIWLKYFKWESLMNKEMAERFTREISSTIDRKIEWYWKNKSLRDYYHRRLRLLEAKLKEVCDKK